MTLDELRAWLAGHPTLAHHARLTAVLAAATQGDGGALAIVEALRAREVVIVQKYDKTDVVTEGLDGLAPCETVVAEYEDGRLMACTTVVEGGA